MKRSTLILAVLLLGVARSDGALNEPERRVRLGTCGADHCIWCKDQIDDVFCPAVGATIVHDAQCNVDLSCDTDGSCTLNTGTTFSGELVMLVDDAPCGDATGACDHGNGAVTKLAFCGTRPDNSTFRLPFTKIDCCRRATSPTGNVACGPAADSCLPADRPRGNPFLCDQNHGNCRNDDPITSCCISEDIIPSPEWLGLQLFASPMADALRAAMNETALPVMTSPSELSFDDHSADGQPTIRRYAVGVSFVTPPDDFGFPEPDCQVTQGATPPDDGACDFCGDGEIDPGEECDDGPSNGIASPCCDANCGLKPGCVSVSGQRLIVSDDADPTKRKITFISKDPGIDTTIGTGIDPVANGALLQLYNANGTGESVCLPLPSANDSWRAKGKPPTPSYSYKDSEGAAGPCKTVKVKHGKLLKAVCQAKLQPIVFSLDEPAQGTLAVRFISGTTAYCASFGGDVTVDSGTDPPNDGGKGKFKAKAATAAFCPPAPPCP